jgi:hypothetical protein
MGLATTLLAADPNKIIFTDSTVATQSCGSGEAQASERGEMVSDGGR